MCLDSDSDDEYMPKSKKPKVISTYEVKAKKVDTLANELRSNIKKSIIKYSISSGLKHWTQVSMGVKRCHPMEQSGVRNV